MELGREKPAVPLAVFLGQLVLCADEAYAEPRLRFGDESALGGRLYKAFSTGTWPKWAGPLEHLRAQGLWPPWRRDHDWLKPNRSVPLRVDGVCRASDAWLVWRDAQRIEGEALWSFLVDLVHHADHGWSVDDLDPVLRAKYQPAPARRPADAATIQQGIGVPVLSAHAIGPFAAEDVSAEYQGSRGEPLTMPLAPEEAVAACARESARYGESIDTPIGAYTIAELTAALHDLAAAYPHTQVMPTLVQARELRQRAWALRAQCQRPGQLRDLHRIAGWLCAILANASFDLGGLSAAQTQARVADLHGELAGDQTLRAWVAGFKALVHYWDGRFEDAVRQAEAAREFKPDGTALVRATGVQARALSRLGRNADTDAALEAADNLRERLWRGDEFAGILTFPRSKSLFWAASANIGLDRPERADRAIAVATEAIGLYEEAPSGQRRIGELSLVRLDLVTARVFKGDADGLDDDVQQVLDGMRERRIDCVVRRLAELLRWLDHPSRRANRHLQRTQARIRDQLPYPPPLTLLPRSPST